MKQVAMLTSVNSKRDRFGNCENAFEFMVFETGQIIKGKTTGSETNIYNCMNLLPYMKRSIIFQTKEMGIRDFSEYKKDFEYGGCSSIEIAKFIIDKIE